MRNQIGASLIEVLVSALILAFGMLALVSMQASATQMTKIAQFKADASRLALSYAERVRTNPGALNSYTVTDSYGDTASVITMPSEMCNGSNQCSPTNIAAVDVAQMKQNAQAILPQGAFWVNNENVGGQTVLNVWVLWRIATTNADSSSSTLIGQGCPAGVVQAKANVTQCLLSRFVLQ